MGSCAQCHSGLSLQSFQQYFRVLLLLSQHLLTRASFLMLLVSMLSIAPQEHLTLTIPNYDASALSPDKNDAPANLPYHTHTKPEPED